MGKSFAGLPPAVSTHLYNWVKRILFFFKYSFIRRSQSVQTLKQKVNFMLNAGTISFLLKLSHRYQHARLYVTLLHTEVFQALNKIYFRIEFHRRYS